MPSAVDDIVSHIGVPVLVFDADEVLTDISGAARQLFGWSDDPVGTPLDRIFTTIDVETLRTFRDIRPPVSREMPLSVFGTGGQKHEVVATVRGWDAPDGRSRLSVVLHETPSVDAAERSAAERDERLRHAVRGARIGIFDMRLPDRVSTVSDTWRRMMRYDGPDEDAQAWWLEHIHPDDFGKVMAADEACIAGTEDRTITEYRMKLPGSDGWRWLRSDAIGLDRGTDGRARRLIGAMTDVTDRRAREEALRVSEAQLRAMIDHAPIGKALVSLEGVWLQANRAICSFLGRSADQLIGQGTRDVLHPDDLSDALLDYATLMSGERSNYTANRRYLLPDGSIVWGMVTNAVVPDADGVPMHFVVQIMDITERRQADRLRRNFISAVSHELRTPITSVLSALDLLERMQDGSDAKTAQLTEIARLNADRLKRLLDDVLDSEKLSSGKMTFLTEEADLRRVALDSVRLLTPLAGATGIRLDCETPETPLNVRIDTARAQQVLTNLLSNAIKFSSPDDGVRVTVSDNARTWAEVAVHDNGTGIPMDFRGEIFKPFAQAEMPPGQARAGTGLGLSISRQLVEGMGGEIDFDSDEGVGSVFRVRFPLAVA